MPLSLYHHATLSHYREVTGKPDHFGHTYGGDPATVGLRFVNLETPFHLIYHLNLADPAIGVELPGVRWLPLCYGFRYRSDEASFTYRVLNDCEVELLLEDMVQEQTDFPYKGHPDVFPSRPVSFQKQPYDPRRAEDALSLASVFPVEHLSEVEMQRAIQIAEERSSLVSEWGKNGGIPGEDFPDFTPAELVRYVHREPFFQGAPSRECNNPECTAEIVDYSIEYRHEFPADHPLLPGEVIHLPSRPIRQDSMRVFALHQPEEGDDLMWGDSYVQLIYQICECCHCIRVSNQCT